MNSIETICNSIIENAQKEKEEKINSAKTIANTRLEDTRKEIELETDKKRKEIEESYTDEIDRARQSGQNAVNKILLEKKQIVLNEIFDSITDNLCNLEKNKYLNLVEHLLIEYAEEGDGISLSKDSPLDEKTISSLKIFKSRNLRFMYHRSNIRGGFVLCNAQNDTIVSFESLVDEYREKYSYSIIKRIFG